MTDHDRLRRIADIIRDLRQGSARADGLGERIVFQLMQCDEVSSIYALAIGEDETWRGE